MNNNKHSRQNPPKRTVRKSAREITNAAKALIKDSEMTPALFKGRLRKVTSPTSLEAKALWYHFDRMLKRASRGRITTPARMIALYPTLHEICSEMDAIEKEGV